MILLCDYAEEVNGKLYIMGGGWTRIAAGQAQLMALAIRLLVPWDQANRPHRVVLELLTEDGTPTDIEIHGLALKVEGKVEVGRPAGVRPGSPLEAPLAFRFSGQLTPGAYQFVFSVDGSPVASASFEAVGGSE